MNPAVSYPKLTFGDIMAVTTSLDVSPQTSKGSERLTNPISAATKLNVIEHDRDQNHTSITSMHVI